MAETNARKGTDVGDHLDIDAESWVKKAYVNFRPVEHQPVTPFGHLSKLEKDDDAAIG